MKILHIVIDRSIKPANSGTSLSLIEDRWMDGWMKDRQKVQSTFLSRQIVLRAGQYSLGDAKNLGYAGHYLSLWYYIHKILESQVANCSAVGANKFGLWV